MGKVININFSKKDEKKEYEKKDFEEEIEITNNNSLDKTLKKIFSSKEEVKDVLERGDNLENLSPQEISVYVKTFMLHNLVKNHHEISSDIFLSTEYIGMLITNFLIGENPLIGEGKDFLYTIDFLQADEEGEMDFKSAGDINISKYIYGFYKYRHNITPADDMFRLSITMYQAAYNKQNFVLGKVLSENLPLIDEKLNLRSIVNHMFPQKSSILDITNNN